MALLAFLTGLFSGDPQEIEKATNKSTSILFIGNNNNLMLQQLSFIITKIVHYSLVSTISATLKSII
jgi:hypothetical protein